MRSKNGFSLIELMVVFVIIFILAVVGFTKVKEQEMAKEQETLMQSQPVQPAVVDTCSLYKPVAASEDTFIFMTKDQAEFVRALKEYQRTHNYLVIKSYEVTADGTTITFSGN